MYQIRTASAIRFAVLISLAVAAGLSTADCPAVTTVTVSPSTFTLEDEAAVVTLQADTAAPGNELVFDIHVDVDGDGVLDTEDERFMSFEIADGEAPHLGNEYYWHDEDGATDSSISATLTAYGQWLFSGDFVVKVTDDDLSTATTSFTVEQDSSHPCVITGEVKLEGSAAGGATALLRDMETDEDISRDVAGPDGTFELRAESPGEYGVYAVGFGAVTKFDEGSAQMLTVSEGTNTLPGPLVLFPGDRTISGRVFASDTGEGFPGVLVFAGGEGLFGLTVTDDDGKYGVTVVDGVWEEVLANEDQICRFGYVPGEERWIVVSGGNVEGVGFLCRRATTLITGTVKDVETQQGLMGISVYAEEATGGDGGALAIGYTEAGGDYMLGVVEGEWWVDLEEDRLWATPYADPPGQSVNAPASGTVSDINFSLEKAGIITGYVYESDGVTPIEEASVDAHVFGTWNWVAYAETFSDGRFRLRVPTGTYMVRVFRVEGWLEQYYFRVHNWQDASPVVVTAPGETSGIDFVLVRAGSITGHVYEDDGVTPIEGAAVNAHEFGTWNWVAYGETRPDGSYTLSVPSGSYMVQVTEAEGWAVQYYLNTANWEEATAVVVTVPNETSGIDFVLQPAAYITGHVYEDDGVTPIEGASIDASVFGPDWQWVASDETEADGSYRLTVPAGTYKVLCRDVPGWLNQFYDRVLSDGQATPVTVSGGQGTSGIDFVLQPAATIRGNVYREDGTTPLVGAWVSAIDTTTDEWIGGPPTGDDGSYSIAVPGGSYRLWAHADGWVGEYYDDTYVYQEAVVIAIAPSEERGGMDFALTEATARIKGHVYQEDGTTPIVGASVVALEYATDDALGVAQTTSDGSYTLPVPPGSFRVNAWAHHYALQYYDHRQYHDATRVTLSGSQTVESIDISLQWIPLVISEVRESTSFPGGAEVQWWWIPGMRYSVYWAEELSAGGTAWREVPDPSGDIVQEGSNGGWMTWTDKGTSPGMGGPPGDTSARQRFYRVLEQQ